MDPPPLPPPPPPFLHHHNLRYGNLLYPPDYIPPPFPRHLPPPPPPQLPFRPYSPPHIAHRPIPHHPHEFHSPPKTYPDFGHPPEILPSRLRHDYRERNPSFRPCNFIVREELYSGERIGSVSDLGCRRDGYEYDNVVYRGGRELYIERDDDERRWNNGISSRDFEMSLDERRRLDYGELYSERVDDDRRMLDRADRDRGCQLYRERDDVRREYGYCINDRVQELYPDRRGYGYNDRSSELYSENDDQKRLGYGFENEFLFEVENRQLELSGNHSALSRVSARLGRRVENEDFGRYKKKRKVQKMSALDRIELAKPLRRRSGGYGRQRVSEESSSSFRRKEKESFKKLETRLENGKEKEHSPMDLAISFKSNALVAKAIMAPSSPAAKSNVDLTHKVESNRTINSINGSLTSSKDIVATNVLIHGLDVQPDVQVSEELHKRSSNSGKRSATTDGSNGLREILAEDKPLEDVRKQGFNNNLYGQTRNCSKRQKRRAKKKLQHIVNLQTTINCGNVADYDINAPSATSSLNSNTILPKADEAPDTDLALRGATLPEKVNVESDFNKISVPKAKRKRKTSATLRPSMPVVDNMITESPVHTEKILNSIPVSQIGTDELAGRAHETSLANKDTGLGNSLGFSQEAGDFNIYVHNSNEGIRGSCLVSKSPLNSGIATIETSQFTTLGCDQNALVEGPCKAMDSSEGCDSADSSRTEKTQNPEILVDKYLPETHQACPAAVTNCLLQVKPEDFAVSGLGSVEVNKEFCANQVNITEAGVNAVGFRSSNAASVAVCLNVDLNTTANSNCPTIHNRVASDELNTSFLDNLSQQPYGDGTSMSHIVCSVKGSPEAINDLKTCFSIDQASQAATKRKAPDVQMDLFGPKIYEHPDTVSSVTGEVLEDLVKNSAAAVDFPCLRDSSEEGDSLDVDGSFSGLRKKRKVLSARLGPVSPRLHVEAGQREDRHSATFTATRNCGTTDMEENVCVDELSILDRDNTLAYDDKLQLQYVHPFSQDLSSFSDQEVTRVTNSGDEPISSDSDVPSCPSSPEDLLLFPDFCFPENTGASPSHSSNGIICGTDKTFNERPISADSNSSIRKPLEKATSNNSQTAPKASLLLPQGACNVQKSTSIIGKLSSNRNHPTSAVPKVFPRYPPNMNPSKKVPSVHVTKSRTWSRTGSTSVAVTGPNLQPSAVPLSHTTKMPIINQSSYIRTGNSLVRKPSPSSVIPTRSHASSTSVYRLDPCVYNLKKIQASNNRTDGVVAPTQRRIKHVNTYVRPEALPADHSKKLLNPSTCNLGGSSSVVKSSNDGVPAKSLDGITMSCAIPECKSGSGNNSDSGSTLDEGKSRKKIMYVKRKSNQLVAASSLEDTSTSSRNRQTSVSDGYYKSRQNQLVRASVENHASKVDAMVSVNSSRLGSQALPPKSSIKRQSVKGSSRAYRSSKFSFVWKLHNAQSSETHGNSQKPHKVWSCLFPWKRATYRRNFILALGSKPNRNPFSENSQKLLTSKKRGAVYTRSKHGYSLRMSKLVSVGGSSLKWSKSIERNSKKANEEATLAVVAAEKMRKEENIAVPVASRSRNSVPSKLVLNVKLRPGERIFRIGSDRYKMDSTRRTLQRITAEEPLPSGVLQPEKNVKRSYVPRRLFIGNNEYVRIGNGNQLVRDPKKRTRLLASEKVRWSLRTARMRLAKKRKYCQFFTRFGKCNKEDGKCPYLHDPSKIVVCTKFLNGSCSKPDCKLTHKVIPERMEDCSYFLKGSCSNENCPYRHVNVDPDSSVCESFLRGYCANGNECRKKHTYVCPAFEATGVCPQATTCKLHHPKKKTEKKPTSEQKIVRGRYFDGGLITVDDCESEKLSKNSKGDIALEEGKYPDYISLDVSDDEVESTMDP